MNWWYSFWNKVDVFMFKDELGIYKTEQWYNAEVWIFGGILLGAFLIYAIQKIREAGHGT